MIEASVPGMRGVYVTDSYNKCVHKIAFFILKAAIYFCFSPPHQHSISSLFNVLYPYLGSGIKATAFGAKDSKGALWRVIVKWLSSNCFFAEYIAQS